MNRRVLILALAGALAAAPSAPAFAAFDWNGTWSGKASGGRTTEIGISGNKVKYWKSNGENQPLGATSVGANSVSIKHAHGASVTLKPRSDGNVSYSWRGTNGSSTAILKKR